MMQQNQGLLKKTVAKIDDVDEKYIVFNPLFIKD